MCGLTGVLSLQGAPVDPADVAASLDAIAHRGPDGGSVLDLGRLVIGHRRLSILDVSSIADQPMTSTDGRYTIVHNGEIYNFLELAEELRGLGHAFRSRTDTEVILEAYAEWGTAAVKRFNGIWAFALWDRVEQILFLSRDRLGVKPMFIAEHGGFLAFASEIKALVALPWVPRQPDEGTVGDFLVGDRVEHGARTFMRGIRRLLPAHNLVARGGAVRMEQYWWPPEPSRDASPRPQPGDGRLIEAVRDLVISSVSLQLRSDVPVGSCLSGGLDSSTVVVVANGLRTGGLTAAQNHHHERDSHPQGGFFADFPDVGIAERPYVDAVVRRTGITLHTVSPTADEALLSLERIARAQDEPFGSTSIVAQYHVMRIAREAGVKVLLDGQGADELFGGYTAYLPHRQAGLLRTNAGPRAAAALLARRSPGELSRVAWSTLTRGAIAPERLRSSRRIRPWLTPAVSARDQLEQSPTWSSGTPLARVMVRDLVWAGLPGLLRYEDRNSMAFGIEARVPFLDHRLVELAMTLPDRLRIEGGIQKVALRRAFEDLVPQEVLRRRDKIGFASPQDRWLAAWRPRLGALADQPRAEQRGLLLPGTMVAALAAWDQRRLASDALWRLTSVEMWARVTLSGEGLPFQAGG